MGLRTVAELAHQGSSTRSPCSAQPLPFDGEACLRGDGGCENRNRRNQPVIIRMRMRSLRTKW